MVISPSTRLEISTGVTKGCTAISFLVSHRSCLLSFSFFPLSFLPSFGTTEQRCSDEITSGSAKMHYH
jgi:hypothetical protein